MREFARTAIHIVGGVSFDEFEPNSTSRLALERALELLGEAARRVSPQFQTQHPEIPWREIIGQRNILAHEYGDVDARRLWHTATEDVPELLQILGPLLAPGR